MVGREVGLRDQKMRSRAKWKKRLGSLHRRKGGVADLKEWGRILNLLSAVRTENCVRG